MSAARAAALSALLVAVGSSACDAPPDENSGNVLVVARVNDAVGLDPSHETDGLSLSVTSEVFQNLVRLRPGSFDVAPDIAASWSSSAHGRVWTFHLRRGLRFSDGRPLDASAVKFNFDRWRFAGHPAHGNYAYTYYESQFGGDIANVVASGPATLTLALKEPLGPLLRNLAMPSFGIGSPAAILKDPVLFGLRPVASGPYAVAEWIRDDHITLKANPAYAGPKPAYQTVIVRAIPDQSTSVLSLEKADISALTNLRPDDAKVLAGHPGISVYDQPSNNTLFVAMNMDRKPFDRLFVRRAVAYAIDIPAIVAGLYGTGAVVADNWTPPGMLGENHAVKAYPHDPARARALLARAGLPDGFATQLYYPTAPRPYMPEPQRVAEAIAADLHKAGIEVTLEPFAIGVFLEKVRNGEHPMCLIGWSTDNGDPDNFMYDILDEHSAVRGSAQNYSFWRDHTFHALMLAGQRTMDGARRRAIYERANAMIHDRVPAVALLHTTVRFAASSSIAGIVPNPTSVLQFELWRPTKR